jgi:membrane protease subunit (stomatin/prohibitin family)
MLRDPEFGPTRLRAFGSFAIKVQDVPVFLRNVVGTGQRFTVDEIGEQLRDMMVGRFADVLGESKMPVLDMAANQDELGNFLTTRLRDDFAAFGLQLVKLVVENISLPPEVEQALDTRTKMGVIGDLSRYTQFQAAEAMRDAAKNPGGIAGAGVGFGAGMAIGNQMGAALQGGAAGGGSPPPVPGAAAAPQQQTVYFVAVEGQQKGPFTLDQLRAEVAAGRIQRNTLAWRNGMPQWTAVEQVPDLQSLFVNVPPPLPPTTSQQ